MKHPRKLLFSLTKRDFVVDTFCSGGKGGSHQNATKSGVRITHPASGAVGEARDSRYQGQNKKAAFERLVASRKFQAWHKVETAKHLSGRVDIDAWVENQMREENLKVEFGV